MILCLMVMKSCRNFATILRIFRLLKFQCLPNVAICSINYPKPNALHFPKGTAQVMRRREVRPDHDDALHEPGGVFLHRSARVAFFSWPRV